jgi:starvation-inducible DNA-binding protein
MNLRQAERRVFFEKRRDDVMSSKTADKAAVKLHGTRKNGSLKTFPAPAPLATPTDLKPEEVHAVVEAVNPLIADSLALFVKVKNFHWHLSGPHFRDYHLLFDEQAEAIMGSLDELAERVRRIGGTTIRSISHISELQTIHDDNDEFVPWDRMIHRLLDDNRQMAEAQRAAIEVCEENRDTPTGNLLQEILNETEKRIWFLNEICQGIG